MNATSCVINGRLVADRFNREAMCKCSIQIERAGIAPKPGKNISTERASSGDLEFAVADLKKICGVSSPTIQKYGKPALGKWIGKGQKGKQFTKDEAKKIVTAVRDGAQGQSVKTSCLNWLKEIET